MDSFVSKFRKELIHKIRQRSTTKASDESTLMKAFKFFDLSNQGLVGKNEFLRALAKVGFVPEIKEGEEIFAYYDKNKTGKVDYREFISSVIPNAFIPPHQSNSTSQAVADNYNDSASNNGSRQGRPHQASNQQAVQELFGRVRTRLTQKGLSGLLSFALMLKSSEETPSKEGIISLKALESALIDYRIREEKELLYKVVSSLSSFFADDESLSYFEIIDQLKVPLGKNRETHIRQAFSRLDRQQRGTISIDVITASYNERSDPNVISGNLSQEESRLSFHSAFQSYLDFKDLNNGNQDEEVINSDEFVEFYSFLNHSWASDEDLRRSLTGVWNQERTKPAFVSQSSPDQKQFSPPRALNPANQNWNVAKFGDDNQSNAGQSVRGGNKDQDKNSVQSRQSKRGGYAEFDTQSMCSQASSTRFMQSNNVSSRQIELILIRIKNRLASKGPKGFLSLERLLKNTDADSDGQLNQNEFKKVVRDYRVDVTDTEISIIFNLFDAEETGLIDHQQFLSALKGSMNEQRFHIVNEVFNKIDPNGEGFITYQDIHREYNPRAHPDVKTTKKHEEDVSNEFFQTMQLHSTLYNEGKPTNDISREQFIDYFNNVSASIEDNQFFETILVNTFRLSHQNTFVNKYAGQRNAFDPQKKGFLQDHHRVMVNGGSVSSNAPFGTSQEPTHYGRPSSAVSVASSVRGYSSQNQQQQQQQQYQQQNSQQMQQQRPQTAGFVEKAHSVAGSTHSSSSQNQASPLSELKKKLSSRGVRGFIKLYAKLNAISRENDGNISLSQFNQGLQELRANVENSQEIFAQFSSKQNRSSLELEDLFKALKGKIPEHRQALIVHAFQGMDKNREGEISLNLLKCNFNQSRGHPNVKINKISEEEAYGDFIDAFEQHMETFNLANLEDGYVHFNEFFEFYHITSATIDDDLFFETLVRGCWGVRTY